MKRKSLETKEDAQRAHITLKAVATATDQGTFTAVISTESIDREKDVVSADGMVAALRKWNRPIPLAWNHSTKPEDQIGHIDPQSVANVDGEVVAGGEVDLESKSGQEAWRSFKSRTVGFSFGYLILTSTKRQGGGRNITGLDVFEVTATPTPMNNDTRVLGWKSALPDELVKYIEDMATRLEAAEADLKNLKAEVTEKEDEPRSVDPLRERSQEAVEGIRLAGIPERESPRKATDPPPEIPSDLELKERFRRQTMELLRS